MDDASGSLPSLGAPGMVPLHDRIAALDNLRDDTEETAPTAIPNGLDLAEFGDDAFTDDQPVPVAEDEPPLVIARQTASSRGPDTIVPTERPNKPRNGFLESAMAFLVAAAFTLVAIALLASLASG